MEKILKLIFVVEKSWKINLYKIIHFRSEMRSYLSMKYKIYNEVMGDNLNCYESASCILVREPQIA